MLPNFPVLTEEQIEQYTNEEYVLVFKFLNAIQEEQPVDLVRKHDFETADRYKQGDKVTKVMNFRDGYNFLKNSDVQYNLNSPLAWDLSRWAAYYNVSDETSPEIRKEFLKYADKL